MEGDKVWFQPLNGNSWVGTATVLCQRGQSAWFHIHGNVKKIAVCRVKPFKLVNQDEPEKCAKKVMLEDGLEDLENLLTDLKDDTIIAGYSKMANAISFSDI